MKRTGSSAGGRGERPPLGAWLGRRRRVRGVKAVVLVAAVGLWLVLRQEGPGAERVRWEGRPVEVVGVVDARTLIVRSAGGREATVRLLGVHIAEGAPAEHGRASLTEAAGEGPVRLSFDGRRWLDPDGRLVAYVYLADGRMANERLIDLGLAQSDVGDRHVLADWFERLERQARARGRGLWADR